MADDMSGKIMDILSNPEMMQKLNDVMSSLGASSENTSYNDNSSNELAANAKNIISTLNHADDRRITLLNALKPYLRDSRANGVDKAIKILKMTKLTEVFKNIEL